MALNQNIVVIVGGVGGAKLALGLQMILPPEQLTVIVNTGDDFWHYGLRICPDIDTVLYTLSGRVDPVNGWGLAEDSRTVLQALTAYGEDTWFGLGDKDLATHLLRTQMLRDGHSLTEVIAHLAKVQAIQSAILPMTDEEVPTIVETAEYGELAFQEYFVKYRWQPTVIKLRYQNMEQASLNPTIISALHNADMILFGPSNPWLSIEPILSVPGLRDAILARDVPRVAVTPIVGGQAIKGPAAKLMAELGYDEVSAQSVAEHYGAIINGFVYDTSDAAFHIAGLHTARMDTIMKNNTDKARLAQQMLAWIKEWN